MKKIYIKLISSLFLLAFVGIGFVFYGSNVRADEPIKLETADCFDYYKFGGVQIDLKSELSSTIEGVPVTVVAKVTNTNEYPIVDGSIYVKVYKKQDAAFAQKNGDLLVDQFFAKDGISLKPKESKDFEIIWQIPYFAISGDYQLVTYFESAKKFNLLGLTFTDDIKGSVFNFSVKSQNDSIVSLDKNNVRLNGQLNYFATPIQRFTKNEKVNVEVPIVNSTSSSQKSLVKWTLYHWDGLAEENILDSKTESVNISPGETKVVNYEISDTRYPVYYLVAEMDYKDTKSVLNVRFVRGEVDRARINFPGILTYPLEKNQKNTIFVCAHNSGLSGKIGGNKLTLDLVSSKGKIINSFTYSGEITGAMMGLKADFVPSDNQDNFILKATLETAGQVVDKAELKYNCDVLGSGCLPESARGILGLFNSIAVRASIALIAIIGIFLFLFIRKRNKTSRIKHKENNVA